MLRLLQQSGRIETERSKDCDQYEVQHSASLRDVSLSYRHRQHGLDRDSHRDVRNSQRRASRSCRDQPQEPK